MQAKIHDEVRTPPGRPATKRELHAGTRSCAGCAVRVPAAAVRRELVRIALVRDPAGVYEAHADVGASGFGRGAWVHARPDCLTRAAAKGLARSVKGRVRAEAPRLALEIAQQADRRVWALLSSARRSRKVAMGSDAVRSALAGGEAALVVVGSDARAAAAGREVQSALAAGLAVVFGDKHGLGQALGRQEVGVVAITDGGIAEALQHALSLAATFGQPLHEDDQIGPETGARQ